MIVHLTARTRGGAPVLADPAVAGWLWRALRRGFPEALAAVLMPSHPHVVATAESPAAARVRLARILGAAARRCSRPGAEPIRWDPVPEPKVVTDREKLRRDVRYVIMNPCRARLVRDPLEWLWSTHRDVMGAVADPWVPAAKLARAFEQPVGGFRNAVHRYVSGDPSCDVRGSPPPRPAPAVEHSRYPLQRIAAAALAATRAAPEALRSRTRTRAAFVLLASQQGWHDPGELARFCGLKLRAVYHRRGHDEPELLTAAALCLGDDRLLKPWCPAAGVSGAHPAAVAPGRAVP
ncbi:MAG: hypothetical protein HY906_10930 [Deltaproteobacteria bacterium]|nr:hypothetical protein [Deltaproteobacteria bacterium]